LKFVRGTNRLLSNGGLALVTGKSKKSISLLSGFVNGRIKRNKGSLKAVNGRKFLG